MRVVVPDLVSPSYFPAIAAVELGLLEGSGLDPVLELSFPVTTAAEMLRDGEIDFLAGTAHAPLYACPDWEGVKILAALSQGMYWFLVARADLGIERGDLSRLAGLRIGAAPGPDLGLRQLLVDAGIDAAGAGIEIAPVPGTGSPSVSFGVTAAEALAAGRIDAFWANGMGAEVALLDGVGTLVVDARRGDGPPHAATYTFPALMATDRTIAERPEAVGAMTTAVVRAQAMLVATPSLATSIGERLFPPREASLIAELVRRDTPFYTAAVSEAAVVDLNRFARKNGLLSLTPVAYDDVVATGTRGLWEPAS